MDVFPNSIQFLSTTLPSPESFLAKFGADPSQLESLVSAKTVTIPRLLEISPHGTLDPSPFIYNSTLYTMVRLGVPFRPLFFLFSNVEFGCKTQCSAVASIRSD